MTRRRIQQTAADPANHFSKWLGYRDIFNWNKCAAPFGCLSCPSVWRVALRHGVESSSRERTSISTRNPLCSSSTDSTTQSVPLSLCCSPSISFPVQDNPARLSQSELWVVRNLSWEIRIVFFAVHPFVSLSSTSRIRSTCGLSCNLLKCLFCFVWPQKYCS